MRRIKTNSYLMLSVSLAAIALCNVAFPVWSTTALNDAEWGISGWYSIISAWGFPLLIAGMGCRYLTDSSTYSTGFVLKKRLPRALVGCAVWWMISTLTLMKYTRPDELDTDTFFESMASVLGSPYNVKFLLLVVALFAFYPLLKRIAENERLTMYAVLVFSSFSILVPVLKYIPFLNYLNLFAVQINWGFFTEFGLYLFLGIFLSRKRFAWHIRVMIYCAGVLSTFAMYACTVWTYTAENGMDSYFVNEASPFTAVQTAAVIVLLLSLSDKVVKGKGTLILKKTAQCAYVFIPLNAVFIYITDKLISLDVMPSVVYLPLEALIALLFALALGMIIRRLPILSYFSV